MVDFLVIGSEFSSTYNNMFHLIKDGDISFGYNRVVEFEDGMKFGNIRWFSNISDYCPPPLVLKKDYRLDDYKRFDERPDIINIDRKSDIPDYDGLMGVPVTFLDKWNYDQFEVIGFGMSGSGGDDMFAPIVEGDYKFRRILIKRK